MTRITHPILNILQKIEYSLEIIIYVLVFSFFIPNIHRDVNFVSFFWGGVLVVLLASTFLCGMEPVNHR